MPIDYTIYANMTVASPTGLRRHTFENGWTAVVAQETNERQVTYECLAVHAPTDRERPYVTLHTLMGVNLWLRDIAERDRDAEKAAYEDERPTR